MFQRTAGNKDPKHFKEVYFLWRFQYLYLKVKAVTALHVILYVSYYGH